MANFEATLTAQELAPRADPDGARRRALALRDALFRGAPVEPRADVAAGGLEDRAAVVLRDADFGRTLLHHAASHGRARAVGVLLDYARRCLGGGGPRAVAGYCEVRDDAGATALDVAVASNQSACAELLRPHAPSVFSAAAREADAKATTRSTQHARGRK